VTKSRKLRFIGVIGHSITLHGWDHKQRATIKFRQNDKRDLTRNIKRVYSDSENRFSRNVKKYTGIENAPEPGPNKQAESFEYRA